MGTADVDEDGAGLLAAEEAAGAEVEAKPAPPGAIVLPGSKPSGRVTPLSRAQVAGSTPCGVGGRDVSEA